MATVIKETLPVVDRIAEVIQERGISNREAARQLGVSPQSIGNWIKANHPPDVNDRELRYNIALFLRVSPLKVLELFGLDISDEVPDEQYSRPDQRKEVVPRRALRPAEPQPCDPFPFGRAA
jgi:transcriptional regulator with XRE-family HTH domain